MTAMKPERWQEIERIYNTVVELDSVKRKPYLEQACAGDDPSASPITLILNWTAALKK